MGYLPEGPTATYRAQGVPISGYGPPRVPESVYSWISGYPEIWDISISTSHDLQTVEHNLGLREVLESTYLLG